LTARGGGVAGAPALRAPGGMLAHPEMTTIDTAKNAA